MKLPVFLCFFACVFIFSLFVSAHEGHHHREKIISLSEDVPIMGKVELAVRSPSWSQSIGSWHLILLHFPLALINMLVISELLFIWNKKSIFESSSYFLLVSAAITALPTALLGLVYSYSASYGGWMETLLYTHMSMGIATAILAIVALFVRNRSGLSRNYYICLVLMFLTVNAAGFFGGKMTFG